MSSGTSSRGMWCGCRKLQSNLSLSVYAISVSIIMDLQSFRTSGFASSEAPAKETELRAQQKVDKARSKLDEVVALN